MRLSMDPLPGEQLLRFVGDALVVSLAGEGLPAEGWRGYLRTNLGRAEALRRERLSASGRWEGEPTFEGASWRDLPMRETASGWTIHLPLLEVGSFRAKAFAIDPKARHHWPEGADLSLSVHPNHLRTGNTLYCAFPRLLGARGFGELRPSVARLDDQGATVIPPSGTLRDLTRQLPHIFEDLRCRILHLLPIGPVPTTFARMGRYGSPYAQLDLTQIDPALVEFDRGATAEVQFQELADGVHLRDGLLLLDIVLNHTGWGSRLMSEHPEWFRRRGDGGIESPGAWGTTWDDLAELDPAFTASWETVAASLLVWCRRGVDGFRCDAGYMVPMPVWDYVLARVRQEFPDTVFLLEGLGGAWERTAERLAGGMQWAYSELFQNFSPTDVSGYLDHALRQGPRLGPLFHYSETHDNLRLAARGAAWSLHRNRLCALASQSGAWGFTSGVEWLATEKIDVHEVSDLRFGTTPNLKVELAALNRLVSDHPCFFDGAKVERVSPPESKVLALFRTSPDGLDRGLVLVNLEPDHAQVFECAAEPRFLGLVHEALGQVAPKPRRHGKDRLRYRLPGGWAGFLTSGPQPADLGGAAYRTLRAQAAWVLQALAWTLPTEAMGPFDWQALGRLGAASPGAVLAALPQVDAKEAQADLTEALRWAFRRAEGAYPAWVDWSVADARRTTLVPPGHPVLIRDSGPFALRLESPDSTPLQVQSVPTDGGFVAALPPRSVTRATLLNLRLDRHLDPGKSIHAHLLDLPERPQVLLPERAGLALLTNGRGAYARVHADLSHIQSKYDALLAANLDPARPTERHVFVKRIRVWAIVGGFLTPLDATNLVRFEPGPPARWTWAAHGGDGRCVTLELEAAMPEGANAIHLRFFRSEAPPGRGRPMPAEAPVRLTLRLDLEDRSHHGETEFHPGLDAHFQASTQALKAHPGFTFAPSPDRRIQAWTDSGAFHPEPEWSRGIPHPLEATRGQRAQGDAWSPGWFECPLASRETMDLTIGTVDEAVLLPQAASHPEDLTSTLAAALPAFLARREGGHTVLAGYPWFLDWGRDSLIVCRGLLAAGRTEEALSILQTFGALERGGTLPNALYGADDANRESSDAPLWFALAVQEAVARLGRNCLDRPCGPRTLGQVLAAIAQGYASGTPTGVRMDPASGLIWSPAHFTWMDTNHPAGSPREGYPIELQALWIRLLGLLETLDDRPLDSPWSHLKATATTSLERYWREADGFAADTLHAAKGQSALDAPADDHLRPNQLWLVTLGLWKGERAQRLVGACQRHLLIPGALRSLAPLPVHVPLAVRRGSEILNDPLNPYQGHYQGDEDARRKPAYHNGTGWVWLLPQLAEALVAAWPGDAAARQSARAVLGSVAPLLETGCLGQLPELVDGDAPHQARGCDAQAWSVSEALRVWLSLEPPCP